MDFERKLETAQIYYLVVTSASSLCVDSFKIRILGDIFKLHNVYHFDDQSKKTPRSFKNLL